MPIDLTDEDPAIIEICFKWLYSHNLPVTDEIDHVQYSHLYVLGKKLMHKAFQDAVLEDHLEVCDAQDEWPTGNAVRIIYDGTTAEAPTRRFLVDIYCWRGNVEWVDNEFEEAPAEIMRDCMWALMGKRRGPKGDVPWTRNVVQYHVGVDGDTARKKQEDKRVTPRRLELGREWGSVDMDSLAGTGWEDLLG